MLRIVYYCDTQDNRASSQALSTFNQNLELQGHLVWASWDAYAITPGTNRMQEIVTIMENADIIVWMGSPDLCGDFFWRIL